MNPFEIKTLKYDFGRFLMSKTQNLTVFFKFKVSRNSNGFVVNFIIGIKKLERLEMLMLKRKIILSTDSACDLGETFNQKYKINSA